MRQAPLFQNSPANLKRSRSKSTLSAEWKIAYSVSALAGLVVIGGLLYLYGAKSIVSGRGIHVSESSQAGHSQGTKEVEHGFHNRWSNMHKVSSSQHSMEDTVLTSLPLPDGENAKRHVVVIGGGLAGCAAALAALNRSATAGTDVQVFLVEKMPKLGGNSAKASSGINALNEPGGDSEDLFETDTVKSGGGLSRPELVHTLVSKSVGAIEMLQGYGVDLSKVTRLGGHSVPRSRTNPVGGNVGWSIMSNVMKKVKEASPKIHVLEGYKLEEVAVAKGRVVGVKLSQPAVQRAEGEPQQLWALPAESVVLATGGFGANKALLHKYNPESAGLATTNGPWATGDVIELAPKMGAAVIDLEQVQVHPTGFVDSKDPNAGTKFLAPEKLRGVGAILLNSAGKRFVDELGMRDVLSAAIMGLPEKRAWLVLSEAGAKEYGQSAIDFYVSKGLMTKVDDVAGLGDLLNVEEATLTEELHTYNGAVAGRAKDPFGKTAFPSGIHVGEHMFVAQITPVVHYTMGGLAIDTQARVLNAEGKPISGLYAAGEVSGGVHGRNRLGGNSLLECAVYGAIAGGEAADFAEVIGRAMDQGTAASL